MGFADNPVKAAETATALQEATVRLERKMVLEALRQTGATDSAL